METCTIRSPKAAKRRDSMKRIGTNKEDQGNDFIEELITFHVDLPENGKVVKDDNAIILKAGEQDAPDD